MKIKYFQLPYGKIAYKHFDTPSSSLTLIYQNGFHSIMDGEKSLYLESWCKENNTNCIRWDYSGYGQSELGLPDSITRWVNETIYITKQFENQNFILAGSSMGAWISLLAAEKLQERCKALLCIAGAFDFTEKLAYKLSPDQKMDLLEKGYFDFPTEYDERPYRITQKFIDDGKKSIILDRKVKLQCPAIFLHGAKDNHIPHQLSQAAFGLIDAPWKDIHIDPNEEHRFSSANGLYLIKGAISKLKKNICKQKNT
ncbi:MAG: alpha/beta hydrolase [Lentisphaeria bacterium]|nr:alpha/beta hydrolase [Lentisphaeria bacterium]